MMMNPEIEQYLHMIEDLRGQVSTLIADVPAEALDWQPVEGEGDYAANSLAVLAAHVAGSERFWIAEAVAGRPPTRDRDSEFATTGTSVAALQHRLDETGAITREILSTLSEEDLAGTRQARDHMVPVRWAILHVIDHTAIHLGHMQLTYQLWMSGQSGSSPRWFERVPAAKRSRG
jgi:uncharacterized damage-inducible protein DinB